MPSATSVSLQQQITKVIKRFKFEELELAVMPTFPEISWSRIRSDLVKHHKNFTQVNASQFIKIAIAEANLSENVLRDRLSTLLLIDISWHSRRRLWYGYALLGSNKSTNHFINRKLQTNIEDYLYSDMRMNVKVNTHDGITYVSLTERSKRKRSQLNTPIFFALFIGQKYFFSSRKNVSLHMTEAIANSMGYNKSRVLKLMGKDLRSLSELCWRRKGGALNSDNLIETAQYKDTSPDIKSTGIDFTQHKQRKKYAEECFGDRCPTLELLVINGPSTPFIHEDASTKLPNENIRATWEFRSHNIATCLTKLIERRVLVTPVPYYISNLMILGKNQFTLRDD